MSRKEKMANASTSDSWDSPVSSSSPGSSGSTFSSRRPSSDVWKYFVKLKEARKAECKLCLKKLAYHRGTSNLCEHLLKVHPLNYQTPSSAHQLSINNCLKLKLCSQARAKAITEKIVRMIILDIRPIHIVECPGFGDMVSVLEHGYVMPSRKTVKSLIFHLYEESKFKIINLLATTSTSVSLTTDIWTTLLEKKFCTKLHFAYLLLYILMV